MTDIVSDSRAPATSAARGEISIIEPRELTIRLDDGHEVAVEQADLIHLVKHLDGFSGAPNGMVVVLLDVDGEEHDVVLVEPSPDFEVSAEETLAQAWGAITPAREALRRVARAGRSDA